LLHAVRRRKWHEETTPWVEYISPCAMMVILEDLAKLHRASMLQDKAVGCRAILYEFGTLNGWSACCCVTVPTNQP
jgi:hypothetical protein